MKEFRNNRVISIRYRDYRVKEYVYEHIKYLKRISTINLRATGLYRFGIFSGEYLTFPVKSIKYYKNSMLYAKSNIAYKACTNEFNKLRYIAYMIIPISAQVKGDLMS